MDRFEEIDIYTNGYVGRTENQLEMEKYHRYVNYKSNYTISFVGRNKMDCTKEMVGL